MLPNPNGCIILINFILAFFFASSNSDLFLAINSELTVTGWSEINYRIV